MQRFVANNRRIVASITRDVGVGAEQILDDQIALLIEALDEAVRPDDPAWSEELIWPTAPLSRMPPAENIWSVGGRTGDQLVIGHDEVVLGATVGADDGTFTHVSYNVLA